MALNTQLSTTAKGTALDALTPLYNTGYIRIYTGSQPTDANTAIGAQTLLSTLRFGSTAFPASSAGVATANAITSDTSAAATGTAAWFRCLKSDGTTVLHDGTVGTSGCNMNLNSTAIQSGATVSISSFTLTLPGAGA